jgi:UDP-N-acetyl-D-glucosamine/UDP-N-acetyl-D-galactosamine dehydrogenase
MVKVCIVGLGYVGLPLAVAFGNKYEVYGFDIKENRILELQKNIDSTKEVSSKKLKNAKITFSSNPKIIRESNFVIIAVPTPVDNANLPNLKPLISASSIVGKNMRKNSTIVYESTVYPGCTEKDCIPILEKESKMKYKKDFFVGYSPERINPGDKKHTIEKIKKVVSGCDSNTLKRIAKIYGKVITAGIHKAPSIKVAEAAKIIENTQRDINIALMNELKMIFDKMNLNWEEVLEAASTKWNFIKFSPGLVGGHCIGVDPYYLAHEANRLGHYPEIILTGRKINDNMAKYEAKRLIEYILKNSLNNKNFKILILGGTFKPNISDIRNSKVEMFIIELKKYGFEVLICEPHVDGELFGCKNIKLNQINKFNFIVKAVNHKLFKKTKFHYELLKQN